MLRLRALGWARRLWGRRRSPLEPAASDRVWSDQPDHISTKKTISRVDKL